MRRFNLSNGELLEDPTGAYVLHADVVALQAERDTLEEQLRALVESMKESKREEA